ncbi:MAG: hypothetical protein Q8R37_03250 [Nanoarchaeota archaeon]|nr:hypothetical protein [Nanoarchaeota archaeon]
MAKYTQKKISELELLVSGEKVEVIGKILDSPQKILRVVENIIGAGIRQNNYFITKLVDQVVNSYVDITGPAADHHYVNDMEIFVEKAAQLSSFVIIKGIYHTHLRSIEIIDIKDYEHGNISLIPDNSEGVLSITEKNYGNLSFKK